MPQSQASQLEQASTTATRSNLNTGDDTMLHRLMDMMVAFQDEVTSLRRERAPPLQSTVNATICAHQEGTMPLEDDDEHITPSIVTPPIEQPAIRDQSTAPTSTTTTISSHQPTYANNTGHKLKASDFPNFYGKENEDIDEWIEKVSAIFEYSGNTDAALLQLLPSLFKANALTWFTSLGRTMRLSLQTWDQWQHTLKEVFEGPDYLESMRRKCLYRSLRVEESFADYYQDKVRLQRFIFPEGTTHRELIKDIITGLPLHMKPLILANITPNTTLFDFRRVLIELEPALRNRNPRSKGSNHTYQNNNNRPFNQSDHNPNVTTRAYAQPRDTSVSISTNFKPANSTNTPRNACFNCGGMHWRSECPNSPKNSGYSSGSHHDDKSRSYRQPSPPIT